MVIRSMARSCSEGTSIMAATPAAAMPPAAAIHFIGRPPTTSMMPPITTNRMVAERWGSFTMRPA